MVTVIILYNVFRDTKKNTPNFYYFKKIFLHFEWLKKYFELQIKKKLWVGTPIFKKISLEFFLFLMISS